MTTPMSSVQNVTDAEGLADSTARAAALAAALEARGEGPVERIETHISFVLLAGETAYKLKKPVRLPFLDFTTLAARRRFSERELQVNRHFAPSLYLDVVDVREGPHGLQLGGEGRTVDVALRMRRFPAAALWRTMLAEGRLGADHVDAMARRLAAQHRRAALAPVESGYGAVAVQERTTRRLVEGIALAYAGRLQSLVDWPRLKQWLVQQIPLLTPLWQIRRHGHVRECHGDLHLGNVLQWNGEPTAFDGLEFDDELRFVDTLQDAAFLAMDLLAHGRDALAWRFVDTYLEASGDYEGLPALRYHLVSRALVRAQVAALAPAGAGTPDYLALAGRLARDGHPRLAITRGLPGAGKSHVARQLVEQAGAIRVRSDVERKRLHGLEPLASSRGLRDGIYDAGTTTRTYARLLEVARIALDARWPIVVDAAFLKAAERTVFATLAASRGVPFTIVDCRAAVPVLRRRLAHRQAEGVDPSEADAAVLDRLLEVDEPLTRREAESALVVDAAAPEPAEQLVRRWLHA